MYNWLWMTLASGILSGFYEIFTKKAVSKTPLLNVLAVYSLSNFLLVAYDFKSAFTVDFTSIMLILLKSLIIFFGWLLTFAAIKGLPISIVTPFGTLTPVFSILLGVLVLNEKLVLLQIIGISIMLVIYYFIGKVGTIEVNGLFKNICLYLMIGGSILSASSALLDKILLKSINAGQLQFWFNFFVAIMYITAFLVNRARSKEKQPVSISIYIFLMSLFLVVSDRIYFSALEMQNSVLSIALPVRKISVVISAIIGGLIFKEKNLKQKFVYACLLILGVALVFAG